MSGRTADEGPDPNKKVKDIQRKVDEVSVTLKENVSGVSVCVETWVILVHTID